MNIDIHIRAMRYAGDRTDKNLIEAFRLDVPSGDIVALVGPTGCGKTTLLKMIAGFERGYDGTVMVGGYPHQRPSTVVQMVFQDYRLLPWKNVWANVAFAADGGSDACEVGVRVKQWLTLAGVSDRQHDWPKTLSGGESARVALARAFINKPAVLLLDEPFRALDLSTRYALQDHLARLLLTEQTTAIMVSHSIEDAVYMCDRIVVLSSRPMTVLRVIENPKKRPRDRNDPALSEMERDTRRIVLEASESDA